MCLFAARAVSRRNLRRIRVVSVVHNVFQRRAMDENEAAAGAISSASTNDPEIVTTADEQQQARAFLRERFLRVVTGIIGKRAEFHLLENTRVTGEFRGCDVAFSEVFVKNLETPIGRVPAAILRSGDIIHLNIDDIEQ